MANRDGQQLGNYYLIRLLGRGGFAEVYLGKHIYLETQVAIKLLTRPMTPKDVQDFLKEARTVARLIHPNIVRVLDFGVDPGSAIPFLVMDYVPKGTLRHLYPIGTPLDSLDIVRYSKQIAAALQYAHTQKVIHRDVKPENMLVESNGRVVLSDFGIAVAIHRTVSRSPQEAAGTISYMAPEQINGNAISASDQYSLGVVIYEWLCGECPFTGTTYIEIAMQHLHSNPPSLCKKKPSISPAVEKVVLKALAKDPQRRFPRVQDFTDALEQALHPLSSLSPQWRIPRRIFVRGLIGLLATGVLVGGGVAIISSVVSTITSSGTMFGFDLQRTNFNPNENMLNTGNVSQLVSYWTTSTGGAILSSPVIANGTLYIGSNDHKLYALDASTGNILWTVTTGDAVYSSPAIANETVYVGSNDHKLYTLDASTGKVLWTVTTGDAIYSSPAVANGMVYVGSNDHKLYTLDASTGKILWTATTGNAVYSSPAIASGTAFVGSNDHRLYALDASTGKVLWTFMTGDAVYSSPAVVNGTVYAGSNDGNVYACDASKGASLWITGESAFNTSLVLTNGVIHAGDSIFYNSTESFYNSPSYLYTSLALTNGVIYAGDSIFYNSTESFYNSPSYLCTLNSSTGKGFWSSKIEDQNSESDFYYGQTADQNSYSGLSSPAVANGIIYVASTDGSLYAIDASTETPLFGSAPTGRILWDTYIQGNNGYKYSDKVFLVSSPLVSDGGVYVGSADGNIYAFHLPGTTPS